MELTIATFNIQNKYKLAKYSGVDQYGNHAKELVDFITRYHIDILGTQEATRLYLKRLQKLLSSDYEITGKYRFLKVGHLLSIIDKYNEANSIITKYKVIQSITKRLPFFPNIPRIITCARIQVENKEVMIYNTHLDQSSDKIRMKQLEKIVSIIGKEKKEFILMGDFNCSMKKSYFNEFIMKIESLGSKRIPIKETTHYKRKNAIDHLFIPSSWGIKEYKVVDLGQNMSDHMPIIVNVKI